MWQCVQCEERLDDRFDICWNCGTSRDGVADPHFRKADDVPPEDLDPPPSSEASTAAAIQQPQDGDPIPPLHQTLRCLRCNTDLVFVGTKAFHEGYEAGGAMGLLAELLFRRDRFDVLACPSCGHVELFLARIADRLREMDDNR